MPRVGRGGHGASPGIRGGGRWVACHLRNRDQKISGLNADILSA